MNGSAASDGSRCGLLEQLVVGIDRLSIGDPDLAAAEYLVADALACIVGALASPEAGPMLRWYRAEPPTAANLAMLLGGLSCILELDAMHVASSVHPGTVVVPAALALAADLDCSGKALVHSVLRGTEAAIRIGRATGASHRRRYQSSSTCGAMGAAVACADLLGIADIRRVDAMSQLGSVAGGLWAFLDEHTKTKQWHCGHAASQAIVATRLATFGLDGAHALMEGPRGFLAVLCDGGEPRYLTPTLDNWQIHRTAYKAWPSPRPTHAAITAALEMRTKLGGRTIDRVEVGTFATAVDLCNRSPILNAHDARFSLRHCVAVALRRGRIDLDAFDERAIEEHADLVARIAVEDDPVSTSRYPERSCAEVRVRSDGETLVSRVEHALGDPERPLDAEAIRAKRADLLKGIGDVALTVSVGAVRLAPSIHALLADCLRLPMPSSVRP